MEITNWFKTLFIASVGLQTGWMFEGKGVSTGRVFYKRGLPHLVHRPGVAGFLTQYCQLIQ